MLALYGTDLHVVDVLGLEADLGGNPDVTAHVLKWVNYVDVSAPGLTTYARAPRLA